MVIVVPPAGPGRAGPEVEGSVGMSIEPDTAAAARDSGLI